MYKLPNENYVIRTNENDKYLKQSFFTHLNSFDNYILFDT